MNSMHRPSVCAVIVYALVIASAMGESGARVHSQGVSLGRGDYNLVSPNGIDLQLEYSHDGRTVQYQVLPQEMVSKEQLKRGERRIPIGKGGTITEIMLARWHHFSLVAVVKVGTGPNATFWCLTFNEVGRYKSEQLLRPYAAIAANGTRDDRILAVSGDRDGPAITIVIGKLSAGRPGAIDSGMIVMHGCPNPAAIDARLGHFVPEYKHESYDLNE